MERRRASGRQAWAESAGRCSAVAGAQAGLGSGDGNVDAVRRMGKKMGGE
jgi:hypothetical protein